MVAAGFIFTPISHINIGTFAKHKPWIVNNESKSWNHWLFGQTQTIFFLTQTSGNKQSIRLRCMYNMYLLQYLMSNNFNFVNNKIMILEYLIRRRPSEK